MRSILYKGENGRSFSGTISVAAAEKGKEREGVGSRE